jgi:hypothetical protein
VRLTYQKRWNPSIVLAMGKDYLPLKAALKAGKLEEFIAQAEAEGVAPVEAKEMFEHLAEALKPPPTEHQTSTGPSPDGSDGK